MELQAGSIELGIIAPKSQEKGNSESRRKLKGWANSVSVSRTPGGRSLPSWRFQEASNAAVSEEGEGLVKVMEFPWTLRHQVISQSFSELCARKNTDGNCRSPGSSLRARVVDDLSCRRGWCQCARRTVLTSLSRSSFASCCKLLASCSGGDALRAGQTILEQLMKEGGIPEIGPFSRQCGCRLCWRIERVTSAPLEP